MYPSTRHPSDSHDLATQATDTARKRYALHEQIRHRIHTDLDDGTHKLNQKLTAWWNLDFRTFRGELKKAFKADVPLKERPEWEEALTAWKADHHALTARLVDIETEMNDRVDHLFALTPAERRTLDDHMQSAMIDYPLGEV